jgi:mRNA-degrading endonuclease RelE of RelBE toxin-antitoxin system
MDKISKALEKLSVKEKEATKSILLRIKSNSFSELDLKKLKNKDDIFRVRKGKIRIIFRMKKGEQINILAIERRSDKTYNNF